QPIDISTKPPTPLGPPEDVEGAIQPPGYRLLGGWARVYRKDRRMPIVARVSLTEYRKSSPNWESMPCTMIRKVSLVQALREAGFRTGGCYDKDEMPPIDPVRARVVDPAPPQVADAIAAEFAAVPTHHLDLGLAAELEAAIRQAGMNDYQRDVMLGKR